MILNLIKISVDSIFEPIVYVHGNDESSLSIQNSNQGTCLSKVTSQIRFFQIKTTNLIEFQSKINFSKTHSLGL